jgi:cytochrome c biogenesis protein ResB
MMRALGKAFRLLASLKVAIPLLVILVGVTIVISLFPTPELFASKWYLGLLGMLGLSLLLITIQHAPMILKRKGRNALIGVITTHLGILVVIAGIIYGGYTGFRHNIKLIEGEVAIVPGLPFVIQLRSSSSSTSWSSRNTTRPTSRASISRRCRRSARTAN